MDKLTLACEMSLEKWSETFPEKIPELEYSKKHEKWKKKLFDKMRGDRYHRFTAKTVKVMLVAAVLCALLLTAFVIPSSREFMLDKFDEYSTYKLTENNKNSVAGEITVGYVPEGFELKESYFVNKQMINDYENEFGECFTVYKFSSVMEIDFNTEFSDTEEIIIDGVKYTYCKGNLNVANLIWTKNDYIYKIDSTLPKEELIKIAESLE